MMDFSFQGKKNLYLCQTCGHGFVSQDMAEGTTPDMTPCLNRNCTSMAHSMMYAAPQEMLADMEPAVTWHRPMVRQLETMKPAMVEYVRQGGLIRSVVAVNSALGPQKKKRPAFQA